MFLSHHSVARLLLSAAIGILPLLLSSCDSEEEEPVIDLEPFRALARGTVSCVDVANRLFLVDDELIFWDRRGNCADAAYSFILFLESTDNIVCSVYDSIAGPQSMCEPAYQSIFDTMRNSLDKPDLGLGEEHSVLPIAF